MNGIIRSPAIIAPFTAPPPPPPAPSACTAACTTQAGDTDRVSNVAPTTPVSAAKATMTV